VNCGACGQSGCESFAEAVVAGRAKINGCPVGGEGVARKVAQVLGQEITNTASFVARVACGGLAGCTRQKFTYEGIKSCTAASGLHNGPKACSFGCLGFGDCVAVCPFNAIVIVDGVAKIYEDNCKSCEKCVAVCPKKLISMVPRGKNHLVNCRSTQKGPVVKRNCDTGCIGCTKCVKVCPASAISFANNLAKIDPLLCTNCGECVRACPPTPSSMSWLRWYCAKAWPELFSRKLPGSGQTFRQALIKVLVSGYLFVSMLAGRNSLLRRLCCLGFGQGAHP
jgi:Na+-translocating ferredoxin:NAD+ oxidoreductase RNF subunit RnfB